MVIWILLHAILGIAYAEEHSRPLLLLPAIAAAFVCVAIAALSPSRVDYLSRASSIANSLAVTLTMVVAVSLVHPWLSAEGLRNYANWPMGGFSGVLVVLMLRRRFATALVCSTVLLTSCTWSMHLRGARGFDLVAASWPLAVPIFTALLVPVGLLLVFAHNDWIFDNLEVRRVVDTQRDRSIERSISLDRARIEEIMLLVGPILSRAAAPEPWTPELRSAARLGAASLRDQLQAPALLNPLLAEQIGRARQSGVHVTLSCGATDSSSKPELPIFIAETREALGLVLAVTTGPDTVHLRLTGTPSALIRVESRKAGEIRDQAAHLARRTLATSHTIRGDNEEVLIQIDSRCAEEP